jgi:hypothetical protein
MRIVFGEGTSWKTPTGKTEKEGENGVKLDIR